MSTKTKRPKRPTCRLRKAACADCGYTIRVTRSWLERGLPVCPCGGQIVPTEAADLAWVGLISQEDVPAPMWTAICRENGWEDMIVRRGAAAKSWSARRARLRHDPAGHCAYPGCGRWVADGAERCSAGHPQHEHAADEPAAMPF
jgi:hypothetical protein